MQASTQETNLPSSDKIPEKSTAHIAKGGWVKQTALARSSVDKHIQWFNSCHPVLKRSKTFKAKWSRSKKKSIPYIYTQTKPYIYTHQYKKQEAQLWNSQTPEWKNELTEMCKKHEKACLEWDARIASFGRKIKPRIFDNNGLMQVTYWADSKEATTETFVRPLESQNLDSLRTAVSALFPITYLEFASRHFEYFWASHYLLSLDPLKHEQWFNSCDPLESIFPPPNPEQKNNEQSHERKRTFSTTTTHPRELEMEQQEKKLCIALPNHE